MGVKIRMANKIMGIGTGAVLMVSLLLLTSLVFAQESETAPTTRFVDADNDGVCDNAVDCSHKEQASGFVDADNDGVCDNAANCPNHQREDCARHASAGGCARHKTAGRCHSISTE